MPNTKEKLNSLLYTAEELADKRCDSYPNCDNCPADNQRIDCMDWLKADCLLSLGVTVQEWISVNEPPKENGYYLCVVCVSAVNQRKEYRRMILFWEDNVWIDMANCFRTKKPLYWMPMAKMPQPPKGE